MANLELGSGLVLLKSAVLRRTAVSRTAVLTEGLKQVDNQQSHTESLNTVDGKWSQIEDGLSFSAEAGGLAGTGM